MKRFRAFAAAAACTCVGCAGPRAVVPPLVPVALIESATPVATSPIAIEATRPAELQLGDLHFDPPLTAALRDYLRRELGAVAFEKDLRVQRLSVKLKSIAEASEAAPGVVGAARGLPPGTPPGAALVGALIGVAIVEGIQSTRTKALVLVNIEGEFGGEPFAGFAYGPYDEADAESIARVVRESFAQARDSLATRAAFRQ